MKRDEEPRGRQEPLPASPGGELERVPRGAGTATAMQQVHLRLTLEGKAAQNLRQALERDGKRTSGSQDHGRLLTSFCVDVPELDFQRYTGSVRVCSCEAFER